MAPMESESEGEIVDQSGLAKAKIAEQSLSGTSVDKRPSTSISAKHTVDHPRSHSPIRSPSRPRPSSRRRSRSPPRRDERQTYRTREDDRFDARYPREPQHNQRYNERDGGSNRRPGGGKDGLPYDDPYDSNPSDESEGDGYSHTRYGRDHRRSNSYGRGYGRDTRYDRGYDRNRNYGREYDRERSPRYDSRAQDRYGRGRKMTGSHNDATAKSSQHLGTENAEKHQSPAKRATNKDGGCDNAGGSLSTHTPCVPFVECSTVISADLFLSVHEPVAESDGSKVAESIEAEPAEDLVPIVVDEEAEIERRRKKRQEVKARLGVQEMDLRVQALEHAASSRHVTPVTEPVAPRDSASGMYNGATSQEPRPTLL